jgi:hypothetical protein
LMYGTLNSELSDYVRFFRLLMALSEMWPILFVLHQQ